LGFVTAKEWDWHHCNENDIAVKSYFYMAEAVLLYFLESPLETAWLSNFKRKFSL
jgi:hypothetical protein